MSWLINLFDLNAVAAISYIRNIAFFFGETKFLIKSRHVLMSFYHPSGGISIGIVVLLR